MRSRMLLFCSVVIPATILGCWTILSKQETGHRIDQFADTVQAAVIATDTLLETQEQLVEITAAHSDLKIQKDDAEAEILNFIGAVGAVGGSKMSKIYDSLQVKKFTLNQRYENQKADIEREREQFEHGFEALQSIYYALQQSADFEITQVEAGRLERLLEHFKSEEEEVQVFELIENIRREKMPEAIKAIWLNPDEDKALAPDIGKLIQHADRLASYENFEDKWAKSVLAEFEELAEEQINPKLDAIAAELSRESERVYADQRNTVLLTGLGMLLSMLGAVLF
ncbi:MAG: hypothetical protein ACRCU5_07715, partial [Rhizobiaceae bacterium]